MPINNYGGTLATFDSNEPNLNLFALSMISFTNTI